MSLIYPLTFLDMLQRAHLETGTSGASPTTVVGQVDQIQRLVMWLSSAWIDVQSAHKDWDYMRASASFATIDGQSVYKRSACGIAAGTFGKWHKGAARNYTTSVGLTSEIQMTLIDYDDWRDSYLLGALRNTRTRPMQFAIAPDKSLCLGPVPNALYTVTNDYFVAPQPLVNDADTPSSVLNTIGASGSAGEIPTEWNMICVYKTMMKYGSYEGAPEVYNTGEDGYNRLIRLFDQDRLPEIRTGGALA